jgi:hypothetical protein
MKVEDHRNRVLAPDWTSVPARLLSPVHAAVLTGDFAEWPLHAEQEAWLLAIRDGWTAPRLCYPPWGFDSQSISTPMMV